jgi:hypothetical protein
VRRIIHDPAYMGQGSWRKSTFVIGARGKRVRRARPDGAPPIAIAYPPLVTPQEWHAANAAGKSGRTMTVRACVENYLLYGGMVRCLAHGNVMSGSVAKQGTHYYRCKRRLYPGGTATHGIRAHDLEDAVWATVQDAMLDETLLVDAAERMAREAEEGMEDVARRKTEVAARLAQLEGQIRWVLTTLRESGATAKETAEQVALVRDEQSRLSTELDALDARLALCQAQVPKAHQVQQMCREFSAKAQHADQTTKRALLELLEVSVGLEGQTFRIEGILGALGLRGQLDVHSSVSSC